MHQVIDHHETVSAPPGEVFENGTAYYLRPVYREVVEVMTPHLKCDGFTAKVYDHSFWVELASGTVVRRSWRTGELVIRVPCPRCRKRGRPTMVRREDLERHWALPHCPVCDYPAPVKNPHHIPFCIRRALGLPDVPESKWDEERILEETRPDLILRQIFQAARKQGRVLAANKIPGIPCVRCSRPIEVGAIVEMIPESAADLLQKRPGKRWAHFSCVASPTPDRANPRAALAAYYPVQGERERKA